MSNLMERLDNLRALIQEREFLEDRNWTIYFWTMI